MGGYTIHLYKSVPILIIPYPYLFKNIDLSDEIKDAEAADILVIGDKMGKSLHRFIPRSIKKLSVNLKSPLKYYNWAREHEGLHRTLFKLKSLKNIPPVIIYLGSNSEFYEKKLNARDHKIISTNFLRYKNPKISTSIMALPFLSKYLYQTPKFQIISQNITQDKSEYSSIYKQVQIKLTYQIFEHELEELLETVKVKETNLITLTSPIKLDLPPNKTCDNAKTDTLLKLQKDIEKFINKGDFKIAFNRAKELSLVSTGNAKSFYLLGIAAKSLGKFKEAKSALQKAHAYDCLPKRSNIIFNNIIRKYVKKHGIILIDFSKIVQHNFGKDYVFIDNFYPQEIFYENVLKQIDQSIQKILDI